DGGGIRGMSELLILKELMDRVQSQEKLSSTPLPCEYFDMIGGTSTGGIIALMLGRLRMSINDAIDCYDQLTKTVFDATQVGGDGKFNHKVLERIIKDVVEHQVGTAEERMLDTRDNTCKTFVCCRAAQDLSAGIPRLFRTYRSPETNTYNCMIWEAARATSAAPTFFERIFIAGPGYPNQSYIDGGLGRNNPTKQMLEEARLIFPDRRVACVISIGTGKLSTISIPKLSFFQSFFQRILPTELIRATIGIATDCEAIEQEVAQRFRSVPDFYYRFNVEQGMQSIGLAEFEKMENVVAHTDQYIRGEEVKQRFANAVSALSGSVLIAHIDKLKSFYYVPSRRAFHFVDRKGVQDTLDNMFSQPYGSLKTTIVSLIGLGGAGKTQVALEYCRRRKDIDNYQGIFWLDATSSKTIENDMRNIARQLEPECVLENDKAAVDMVKSILSNWTDLWLLVFDNLDNPSEIAAIPGFFPESGFGSILITSRYHGVQELGQHCLLQEMDEGDGLSLLLGQQYSEEGEEDEVLGKKIIELLGHLPLAIDQARAYISRRRLLPQDFITEFNNRKEELFKATPSIWQYKRKPLNAEEETILNVATTWEMSLSLLDTSMGQPSKELEDILTLFAFFHPRAISEDIFSNSIGNPGTATSPISIFNNNGKWNHLKFEDILTKMQELSLLQFSRQSNSQIIISIHSLVSQWLCMRLEISLQKNFIQFAMLHLEDYLIWLKDYDISSWGQAVPHVDTLSLHPPNMIDYFSDPFYEVAHTFGALGPNHTSTLTTVNNLGLLYSQLGQLEKAERMYEWALAGFERALGPNHTDTLTTVNNLGLLYSKLGWLEEAERMYERALAGSEKALGSNHTSILTTVNNLGLLYSDLGRFEEAERMYKQALAGYEKALGPNHTDTLTTVHNLRLLYNHLGRHEEAERIMYERALAGFEKALGPNHTFTLTTVNNLGGLYSHLGRLEEAERMYEWALAGKEKALGPNHTETLITVNNLGLLYSHLGQLEEAERMYEQVLAGFEKALGPNYTETLTTVHNLGLLYSDLEQLEEAERMYEQALAGKEKAVG
ncbi:hypothetical protein M422DRAFT_110290, partial [Sphaerobolus stellatus SS14]